MSTELNTPRAWAVLLVLSGAIFLEGIDVSMMGVALPSMREELDLSTSSLQWVVSAYVLGYGGFVLLGGRAADLLGRRRMLLLWLGIFIAFSRLAAGPARNRAVLIYSGTAAAGFSLGMVAGGLLTAIDWRWVFFAPVIMAAAIFAAAVRPAAPRGRPGGDARGGLHPRP